MSCNIDIGTGVCDGDRSCVSIEFNPCSVHGCGGKKCGDECLQGDIQGVCDAEEICQFGGDVNCGKLNFLS